MRLCRTRPKEAMLVVTASLGLAMCIMTWALIKAFIGGVTGHTSSWCAAALALLLRSTMCLRRCAYAKLLTLFEFYPDCMEHCVSLDIFIRAHRRFCCHQ